MRTATKRPNSTQINFRLDDTLFSQIKAIAKSEERAVASIAKRIVKKHLEDCVTLHVH